MKRSILIVDDQPEIAELLRLYLEKEDYYILEASDGQEAINMIPNNKIDLMLIDLMMPTIDGYQLIKRIRETLSVPIIIISAKNEDNDKILGLGLGADDFIQKPFNPFEVVARVQALLRRSYSYSNSPSNQHELNESRKRIELGDIILDENTFTVIRDNVVIPLTKTEFKILELLMGSPGRVYTKKQIFERVWDDYYIGDEENNTINVHISKIRDKIEKNPKVPIYLKTVRGLGYKFEEKTK
ncbi:response regulator transcription factor [Fredinandcohnia humi]